MEISVDIILRLAGMEGVGIADGGNRHLIDAHVSACHNRGALREADRTA